MRELWARAPFGLATGRGSPAGVSKQLEVSGGFTEHAASTHRTGSIIACSGAGLAPPSPCIAHCRHISISRPLTGSLLGNLNQVTTFKFRNHIIH